MNDDLHTDILATLKRVEELVFQRAEIQDRFGRERYYRQIAREFKKLFDSLGLEPGSHRRERLENIWAAVLWGNPGFMICLYPQFALETLGQINWELFHEESRAKPVAITGRKVQHLTVVEG